MTNTTDQALYSCFARLNEEEKKSVLQMLETFLKNRSELQERISLEQYNREIDEAMDEAAAGDYISQEEMEREASKW